jgi:RNA polymerase sigma-70 factor (ECF subfamily)
MQKKNARIQRRTNGLKLYRTCKRYLKKEEEIEEEALADALYYFTKLDQLKEFISLVPKNYIICLATIKKHQFQFVS